MRFERIPATCVQFHRTVSLKQVKFERIVDLNESNAACAQKPSGFLKSPTKILIHHCFRPFHFMPCLVCSHSIGESCIEMGRASEMLPQALNHSARYSHIKWLAITHEDVAA